MCRRLIHAIIFVLVLSLANAAVAGLVAHYPLDEGSGTTAGDASGNGHDGTIIGADVEWVESMGGYGWALDFPGTGGQYCDTGTWNPSAATGQITVAFWMNWAGDHGGYQGVVAKRDTWAEPDTMWCIEIDMNSLMMNWHRHGSWVDVGISPPVGEWQHVAFTFDGSTTKSYTDGNLYKTAGGFSFGPATGAHVVIGVVQPGSAPFNGTLDEVRIYDHALSATEVKSLTPRYSASNPNPGDGAVLAQTAVALTWTAGTYADSHHVYFGTNFDDVYNGTGGTDKGPSPWAAYFAQDLEGGKTYYWRIDEVSPTHPDSPWRGPVWSFTVSPKTAWMPNPPDGSKFIDPNVTLTWSAGMDAFLHHLYFGEDFDSVDNADTTDTTGIYKGPQNLTFDPGPLALETVYYWRVDEFDGSEIHKSDVWTFTTTAPGLGTILREVWEDIGGGSAVTDLTSDPRYPDDPSWSDELTVFDFWGLGLDNYGSRLRGWLYVPAAGDYTFWIAADNGSELWLSTDDDPSNVGTAPIAQVPGTGWTGHYEWDKYPEQQSAPITLESGRYYIEALMKEGSGGDGVAVAWQGPSIPTQQVIEGIYLKRYEALWAFGPRPANGATGVTETPTLSWKPGEKAVQHDVYLGTGQTAVADADTTTAGIYRGRQDPNSYTTEALEWDQTYYWRIDEVNTLDPAGVWKGSVWSFTVADYLIVDDFEHYDDFCNRIFYTWGDGWGHNGDVGCGVPPSGGNGTGSTVGYLMEPYAEQIITHDGSFQSMPFEYLNDGSTGKALYSETEQTFDPPQNWAKHGPHDLTALTLWFRGLPESVGSFSYNPAADIYTMTADGWDISGTADGFHYAFKRLSGVGSIQAQVLSVQNTNEWAKAGVMIREDLDPNSAHAMTFVTPGQGVVFEYRPSKGADNVGAAGQQTGITAPHWVRITRSGNTFTAEHSTNGSSWDTVGTPQTIPMAASVYVGLAVTSHDAALTCQATFSDVTIIGTVMGQWQSQDIGITSNDAEQLYVAVEDSTGTSKAVDHPEPNAVQLNTWQEWNIDLNQFSDAGVNLQSVRNMYIGVGNRNAPTLGGSGMLYVDDIRLYQSRCLPSLAKPAGDFNNNCVVDYPDLDIMTDNWLITDYDVTPADPGTGNLVAYYTLQNNTNDGSGSGHHGDPCGAPTYVPGPAGYGTAMHFDGTSAGNYVDLGTFNPSAATGELTVAVWAKWDGLSGYYQGLVGKRDSWSADDMMWHVEANRDTGALGFARNGSYPYDGDPVLPMGQWTHVAASFDGTTASFYINGELTGSGPFSFGSDTGARVVFGAVGANGNNPFNGALDEVRIYDRGLTQEQVAWLAGKTTTYTQPLYLLLIPPDPAMDMDSDGIIDLKDYAALADMWLDEILWP
jgi:hypothetical protein